MSTEPLQVLLVEDDPKVAYTVAATLRENGFRALRCGTGQEAIARFESDPVDLVILDLGLPDVDGMAVLQRIRAKSPSIPVLVLTARDAVKDRIAGLDGGADDYLVKPFSLSELLARLRALVRRVELGRESTLRCEDLELDTTGRVVSRAGQAIDLSPREFDLLKYLLEHRGQVVTRSMLARDVWKYTSRVTPIDNIIDVQVSRLRDKVDKPFGTALIRTIRGVGFTLEEPP
jgi:two-component system, OmpR family, copper resistance phosphate regulon response regulator CusR